MASFVWVLFTCRWNNWHRSPRVYMSGTAVSIIDATFYSVDELIGKDMFKILHSLVTQTMEILDGLDITGRGPEGRKIVLTHLFTQTLSAQIYLYIYVYKYEKKLVQEKGYLTAELGMNWDLSWFLQVLLPELTAWMAELVPRVPHNL